jgi:hypothetical protein
MGLIIMKKSMKKFLFIAFVLLGIVACKEDLSEYYNRLEQREALNKRVEDDNASLEAQNVKQAAQNDNQDAENEAQALRNEEIRKWNAEQILRNAEQGILNDAMSSVLDSLLRERDLVLVQNTDLSGKAKDQAQINADQAQRNGQLRLMWEALQQRLDSLERVLEERVEPKLLTMEFVTADNNSLRENTKCKIVGDSIIECWLSGTTNSKVLKPRFTFEGTMVVIDGFEAESGKTEIDFTRPRTVLVATSDKKRYYTIYVHSFTGLPMMTLTTDGLREVTSKETYIGATLTLREDVRTRAAGDYVESRVNVKGRGNSSWKFPKKPLRLKFDEKISLLDMHKDKSWVLIPNYND